MTTRSPREDQILVALRRAPLDRIRLMKTVFLAWYREKCPSPAPFEFQPYMYGPCAFSLYGTLETLQREGLVVQPPHSPSKWSKYYLTQAGIREAEGALVRLGAQGHRISEISEWAANQTFRGLLDSVYAEAPDFATVSVFRS